jgi:hypothetical protein
MYTLLQFIEGVKDGGGVECIKVRSRVLERIGVDETECRESGFIDSGAELSDVIEDGCPHGLGDEIREVLLLRESNVDAKEHVASEVLVHDFVVGGECLQSI